jgi:hypothetical protein
MSNPVTPHHRSLEIARCPHCSIAHPNMRGDGPFKARPDNVPESRIWATFVGQSCGGVVLAEIETQGRMISRLWPDVESVSTTVPDRARQFLEQAIACLHSPAGAVMLVASSIDAMLKAKKLSTGSLYDRIEKAVVDHLITEETGAWAHDIRLDANDQRHADDLVPLPNATDAKKVIAFAQALAQFLFVLPAMVERGRKV